MSYRFGLSTTRIAIIGLLLLTTQGITFFLIAGAATTDAGTVGWILIVVVPLTLLGTGLYLLTGDRPDWWSSVGRRV
ncbi:hypothetical protein [Haladaptatus sp. NG-SE-30]